VPVVPERAAWRSAALREHPLVGKVWDAERGAFVGEADVTARIAAARYVLLGEKHDNADHHVIQARLVGAMAAAGRRPTAAFEMIEPGSQALVDRYLVESPRDASRLGEILGWEKGGWPPWPMYEPIAQAAMAAGMPLAAANLPRQEIRKVVRGGLKVLGPERTAAWGLDRPLPVDGQAALDEEMRSSHCGQLPEEAVGGMSQAQRARDAAMADALISRAQPDGGVLIAGNGHVRADRGVPFYLAAREPGAAVVSVSSLEVIRGLDEPAAYARGMGAARLPYTFVIFTPRVDEKDPCERFHQGERASL
jgi:uncharacterized iron-regulated protein